MRVLLIVHGYPPQARAGTELYTEGLAGALREHGDEVLVLTREADPARPEYALRRQRSDGVEVVRVNHTFRYARSFADSYRNPAIRRLAGEVIAAARPEVAHVHHLTCLSADLCEELAAQAVPTLLTLHDYWMICHRGQLLDRELRRCAGPFPAGCASCLEPTAPMARGAAAALRRRSPRLVPLAARLHRLAAAALPRRRGAYPHPDRGAAATLARAHFMRAELARPALLLAPSQTLRERFLAFGAPAERLLLHELGLPLSRFRGLARVPRNGPLRLGFLGTLMVSKGPHLLLDAFARLPPGTATLDLFGELAPYHGDESYPRRLQPLLHQPGVTYRGHLPHAAVPQALAALDVLVVPSLWLENSPLALREAFAAGVPVVAARLGAMAERIADGRSGLLFAPGDAADLTRCLRRLIDEPGLIDRLRAGIPAVRDLADDAARTRELYAAVRRPSPPAARPDGRAASVAHHPRRLAAIVLHYRTPADTLLAARSLEASRRPVDDLIVVDNGSGDGSAELLRRQLPGATVLATGANRGFAGGCNHGIEEALQRGAELVLLLNSDAVLPPDALATLVSALAEPRVGIAGPLVLSRRDPDRIATAGIRYSRRSGRMRHRLAGAAAATADESAAGPVDAVSGCAMLLRREVLEAVGPLADEYFFSFEDLDLCLRARAAGWLTVCVRSARVYHEGGATIGARSPQRLYYAARNHLLLASRHGAGGRAAGIGRAAVVVALNLAHALRAGEAPRRAAVAAVLRGIRDHRRRRYGQLTATT